MNENTKVISLSRQAKTFKRPKLKVWYIQIFTISLLLSILFAIVSELMLMHASLVLAILLLLFLILLSVIFDIVGVAVAACGVKPILEFKAKGIKGAVKALWLLKNADKVSCICTDVVGDICSILCGAAGVAISVIIVTKVDLIRHDAFVSILISSIIASLIILGKATGKSYAVNYAPKVVLKVGKFLSLFKRHK